MSELIRTTLAIPDDLLADFDAWMAEHDYTNRSEAVRDLVRLALTEDREADPKAHIVAVLPLVYKHSVQPALGRKLTKLVHDRMGLVLCAQHVHLEDGWCCEVLVLNGRSGEVREFALKVAATKGIRAVNLNVLPTLTA
jgi:CopG family nickel-responsive transcriptional regulator